VLAWAPCATAADPSERCRASAVLATARRCNAARHLGRPRGGWMSSLQRHVQPEARPNSSAGLHAGPVKVPLRPVQVLQACAARLDDFHPLGMGSFALRSVCRRAPHSLPSLHAPRDLPPLRWTPEPRKQAVQGRARQAVLHHAALPHLLQSAKGAGTARRAPPSGCGGF